MPELPSRNVIDTRKTDQSVRHAALPEGLFREIEQWRDFAVDTGVDAWVLGRISRLLNCDVQRTSQSRKARPEKSILGRPCPLISNRKARFTFRSVK